MTRAATPAYRPCPACDGDAVHNIAGFAKGVWRIGACRACDFVFLRNPVTYDELKEDFAWEQTFWSEDKKRRQRRGTLKRLASRLRTLGYRWKGDPQAFYLRHLGAGKILDIGCGDVVRWSKPFVPFGIEISTELAKRADTKMRPLGGRCYQGAGADVIFDLPKQHFDSVMMHSYLEHEVRFRDLLRGCHRVLKRRGRAFVRVPNFASFNRQVSGAKWPGFRYPDHVNYFTPSTLRTAAREAGFRFRLVNRHKIWVDDNVQAVLIKKGTS